MLEFDSFESVRMGLTKIGDSVEKIGRVTLCQNLPQTFEEDLIKLVGTFRWPFTLKMIEGPSLLMSGKEIYEALPNVANDGVLFAGTFSGFT